MVGSIDPGCEQIRGTHWPNKGRVVDWNSCRGNHLGQRSQNDRINRPDIWTQAIRLHIKKLLCHGGRPHMVWTAPTASVCQNEVVINSFMGAVREPDYPRWDGYV